MSNKSIKFGELRIHPATCMVIISIMLLTIASEMLCCTGHCEAKNTTSKGAAPSILAFVLDIHPYSRCVRPFTYKEGSFILAHGFSGPVHDQASPLLLGWRCQMAIGGNIGWSKIMHQKVKERQKNGRGGSQFSPRARPQWPKDLPLAPSPTGPTTFQQCGHIFNPGAFLWRTLKLQTRVNMLEDICRWSYRMLLTCQPLLKSTPEIFSTSIWDRFLVLFYR